MRNPLGHDDPEAQLARREERQARREARRREHEPERKPVPPKLSKRAEARLQSEPTEPPAALVVYSPWTGRLSPYERTKLPRKRDVKVQVMPQSKRRPWAYGR
jgi:hypothetical protein